jgi:predicted ATPase
LSAVHQLDDAELQRRLRALSDSELLYVRGVAPEAVYQFKHALIRDAAYEALLKSRRKELHRAVAQTIDTAFPTIKESHPEVLARHWTEAGELESGIREWQRAGERARRQASYEDALVHFDTALDLLKSLPENQERNAKELELQLAFGQAQLLHRGYASPGAEKAYRRAAGLAETLKNDLQLLSAEAGIAAIYIFTQKLFQARSVGVRLLDLADRTDTPVAHLSAHCTLTTTFYYLGNFIASQNHAEKGIASFATGQRLPASLG